MEWIGAPVQDVVCGLPCTSNDDDDLRVLQEKSCVSCRFWCCKYINHHKSHDLNPFLTMSAFLTMFCQPFASVNFSYFRIFNQFKKNCHKHPLVNSLEVCSNLRTRGTRGIIFKLNFSGEHKCHFFFQFLNYDKEVWQNCIYNNDGVFFSINFVKTGSEVSLLGIQYQIEYIWARIS